MDAEAAISRWANFQFAAKQGDPFLHSDQSSATTRTGLYFAWTLPVIDDVHLKLILKVRDRNTRSRWSGVLEDVGKSFLDDPICGEVEAWWEFPGFNFHIDLHR